MAGARCASCRGYRRWPGTRARDRRFQDIDLRLHLSTSPGMRSRLPFELRDVVANALDLDLDELDRRRKRTPATRHGALAHERVRLPISRAAEATIMPSSAVQKLVENRAGELSAAALNSLRETVHTQRCTHDWGGEYFRLQWWSPGELAIRSMVLVHEFAITTVFISIPVVVVVMHAVVDQRCCHVTAKPSPRRAKTRL